MNDFRMKLMQFMSGRYGNDQLNKFIFALIIACFVLSLFGVRVASKISLALVIIYTYRAFSKNYNQRYHENQIYLKHSEKIRWKYKNFKNELSYRKTHKIFKCSKCHKKLSVPKGKGKIEVACPCGNKIITKT